MQKKLVFAAVLCLLACLTIPARAAEAGKNDPYALEPVQAGQLPTAQAGSMLSARSGSRVSLKTGDSAVLSAGSWSMSIWRRA